METELCISYSQIVEGAATCEYCDQAATVTVSTGADPEPAPMCWHHARDMLDVSLTLGNRMFAVAA